MNSRVSVFDALIKMNAPMYGCSPGVSYDLDVDYNNILWNDDATPEQKPTKEQVQEKIIELEAELPMEHLRQKRNFLLKRCDIYGLVDFSHKDEATKQAWLDYRKALRDLTINSSPQLDDDGNLTNVTWPTPPS
tara:strand:+ start:212 stop:613 length:402 start_codon:yes stop_codon:yes gene_type:complete